MSSKLNELKNIWDRFSKSGIYPHQLAFLLDIPIRKILIKPEELVEFIGIRTNYNILEIGPGPGYFSVEFANRTLNGNLFLMDIQKEMLDKCRKKLNRNNIQNYFTVQGDASNLPFKADYFDLVVMVTVIGEVIDKDKCLSNINKILKNEGILAITELKGDADVITESKLTQLLERNDYNILKTQKMKYGFTSLFKKIR